MENRDSGLGMPIPAERSDQLPALFKQAASLVGFDEDEVKKRLQAPDVVPYSVSVSMPSSPSGLRYGVPQLGSHVFNGERKSCLSTVQTSHVVQMEAAEKVVSVAKFHHSQPLATNFPDQTQRHARLDKRFNTMKTWSGKLERQLSNLRGNYPDEQMESSVTSSMDYSNSGEEENAEPIPVHRYYDALEGPELDTLKPSEVSGLPEDSEWPFLLRFPISSFGICLGVGSQAMLWKTLATSESMAFLKVSPMVNLVLWVIALILTAMVFTTYGLKIIFYFEAVRREYHHPVRVNFFFAPWIACLFLALGIPPSIVEILHPCVWYILMAPILCLELKIYGQWMSGGQRRLSKVANPSNHLSIVGNFVGALLGASMGLKEGPIFFFAIGLAHYIVLFVTLYQRLPTNESLPKELHPVFFLFVAAPSVACTAWAKICGDFDYGSRIAYFIAIFLYFSLVVRVNFFWGFKFSLAWWAYTFPMTGASIATIAYSREVRNPLTQGLSVALSSVSTITVTVLLVTTILYAFWFKKLFPNDDLIGVMKHKKTGNIQFVKRVSPTITTTTTKNDNCSV